MDHEHALFTRVLEAHVSEGLVDYVGLANNKDFPAYIQSLESVCAADYDTWSRDEKLAYWINVYNAYTLRLILDNYPLKSIRSIGFIPFSAFKKSFIPTTLEGEDGLISLSRVENKILRAKFNEPRIHFAINCASASCPELSNSAYRARDLSAQLERAARSFLADPARNRWSADTGTLYLSAIFKWFSGDFEGSAGSVQAYVERLWPAAWGDAPGKALNIEYLSYDWSLNGR